MFGLVPSLEGTLATRGLVSPTEIQLRAIPPLLTGKSVVGVAETGSGKTLAYTLPILHHLKCLENDGVRVTTRSQPRAVVVVPTRELGEQVSKVMKLFTHETRLRVRTVLGGTTTAIAKNNVEGPFEVLVATPGRLIQMMKCSLVFLNDVRLLVFDEADQMMDAGFLPDATRIVEACPPNRQLGLFSATVPDSVQALIVNLFSGATVIRSQGSHRLVPTLTTENRKVFDGKRFPILESLLAKAVEGETLIFTNTREQCDSLVVELQKSGRKCAVYRGEMDKIERRANLKAFREGEVNILVATDLASRGLDLEHVSRVINYHLPEQIENYLHRAGRTARAGRAGLVVNLITERDHKLVASLDQIRALVG